MKIKCTICLEEKEISCFHKSKINKSGYRYQCKTCRSEQSKAWRIANDAQYREKAKLWRAANKDIRYKKRLAHYHANQEKQNAQQRELLNANPERRVKYKRQYAKRHPDRLAEAWQRKSHVKKNRSVSWADIGKMRMFYAAAKAMNFFNPCEKHHVDHIIPLRGESVSGLHVENNLQMLTASENIRKGNCVGAMGAGSGKQ